MLSLNFFGSLLRGFVRLEETFFLHLIVSFCHGCLTERLASVLVLQGSFDHFNQEALEFFILVWLRERLTFNYFSGLQRHGEILSAFEGAI